MSFPASNKASDYFAAAVPFIIGNNSLPPPAANHIIDSPAHSLFETDIPMTSAFFVFARYHTIL
jgi:hypothetical protein